MLVVSGRQMSPSEVLREKIKVRIKHMFFSNFVG